MTNAQIEELSSHILRYLLKHPEARDSIEGIAEWWVLLQRIEDEVDNVKKALDLLIQQGLVEVEEASGATGRRTYRLNLKNREAIARFLEDLEGKVFG